MKHFWLALAAACALAACGGDNKVQAIGPGLAQQGAPAAENAFAATLDTPGLIDTESQAASGSMVLDPDSREIVAVLTTTGGVSATATIRSDLSTGSNLGSNSTGTAVTLSEQPPGSGVWTGRAALSAQQVADLRGGRLFFEFMSAAIPGGVLRGQILPQPAATSSIAASGLDAAGDTSGAGTTGSGAAGFGFGDTALPPTFAAALRGAQVVPPTPSVAQGSGSVSLRTDSGEATAAIALSGTTASSAALMIGRPGTNGSEALALSAAGQGVGGSEVWLARAQLSDAARDALAAGETYFIVRSDAYPEGELRGQVLPQVRSGIGAVPDSAGSANGLAPPATTGTEPGFGFGTPLPPLDVSGGAGSLDAGFGNNDFGNSGSSGFGNTGVGNTGFNTGGFNTGGFNTGNFDSGPLGTGGFDTNGPGTAGFDTNSFDTAPFDNGFDNGFDTGTFDTGPFGADPFAPSTGSTGASASPGLGAAGFGGTGMNMSGSPGIGTPGPALSTGGL